MPRCEIDIQNLYQGDIETREQMNMLDSIDLKGDSALFLRRFAPEYKSINKMPNKINENLNDDSKPYEWDQGEPNTALQEDRKVKVVKVGLLL